MKFFITAAIVLTLLLLGLNIFQALDGLDSAIGQEKWFSEGTRDLLRGAIGVAICYVALDVLLDWKRRV